MYYLNTACLCYKFESYNIIWYTNLFTELTAVKEDEIDINILQKQDGELKAEIHFDVSNAHVSLQIGGHTISITKQVYRISHQYGHDYGSVNSTT